MAVQNLEIIERDINANFSDAVDFNTIDSWWNEKIDYVIKHGMRWEELKEHVLDSISGNISALDRKKRDDVRIVEQLHSPIGLSFSLSLS